ncbi:MAG: HNH endonuclease signature motif containing protein [Gemmatimonadota bacterium]
MSAKDKLKPGTAAWWSARTRFDPTTGCVLWAGFADRLGYCRTTWKGKEGTLVHRVAYEQVYGPFDPSLKICHTCDTPTCVNPLHLFLGTHKDNMRDMFAKGRARPRGKTTAPLTAFPAVSYRVLRREKQAMFDKETLNGGGDKDIIHLIRTIGSQANGDGEVPVWCRVTNVPPTRPTQAIVKWEPAKSASPQFAPEKAAVATPALCCPSPSSPVVTTSGTSEANT